MLVLWDRMIRVKMVRIDKIMDMFRRKFIKFFNVLDEMQENKVVGMI